MNTTALAVFPQAFGDPFFDFTKNFREAKIGNQKGGLASKKKAVFLVWFKKSVMLQT